jgi:chemotaxis protein CheD
MAHVVGVGDMRLGGRPGEVFVAPHIGAGIAIALYDATANVAGILHFMLPASEANPHRAIDNPALFADTGIPAFLRAAMALGASRQHMRIRMVGGARPIDATDFFAVGARNQATARRVLWDNLLSVDREQAGGTLARTLRMDAGTGRTWVRCDGEESEL